MWLRRPRTPSPRAREPPGVKLTAGLVDLVDLVDLIGFFDIVDLVNIVSLPFEISQVGTAAQQPQRLKCKHAIYEIQN